MSHRSLATVAALATVVLSACGASAPPPVELAEEIIETLDVSDAVKDCMRERLSGYTDQDLESITNGLASDNTETQAEAEADLARFESDLASCN